MLLFHINNLLSTNTPILLGKNPQKSISRQGSKVFRKGKFIVASAVLAIHLYSFRIELVLVQLKLFSKLPVLG